MRLTALFSVLAATSAFAAPRRRDVATTTTTTTATAYTTDTVHVTVTDTAYVIAELPPCAATGSVEVITTVEPASASGASRINAPSMVASVASQVGSTPSGSAGTGGSSGNSGNGGTSSSGSNASGSDGSGTSTSSAPVPTMTAVIPNHIDPHNTTNLQPSKNGSTAYQQNGTDSSTTDPYVFAEANVTYQYPTVILPHSALISSVACASDGLLITFDDKTAYDYVHTHWTIGTEGFLLVADWQACMGGSSADAGGHVYYLVTGLTFNDSTMQVHAIAHVVVIENALDQVDLTWGTYTPGGNGSLPYGGGAGSGDGGSDSGDGTSGSSGSGSSRSESTVYTNGTDLACLHPPSSYEGLPTAPCGYDFDTTLDNELGYYDLEGSVTDGEAFAPGYEIDNTTFVERSMIAKRAPASCRYDKNGNLRSGHFFCAKKQSPAPPPPISAAERAIINKLNSELAQYTNALKNTVNIGKINGISPSFQKTWGVSAGPTKLVDSKFGKGNSYLLYSDSKGKNSTSGKTQASASLNVYCVDCKVQGAVTIAGYLSFSVLRVNVDAAQIGLYGTAYASAKLGIAVEAAFSSEFNQVIFDAPIPNAAFKIVSIVEVGAFTKLAATGKLEVNAEGQLLVGATASVPNFKAVLDAVGSGSTISGFSPVFNKTFDAQGQISVTAGLGLPMSIAVKVNIPLVKFQKELALVNTPSITASATLKASNDGKTDDCNNGLAYNVIAKDALDFKLVDKIYPLTQINKTLVEGCYTLPYAQNKTVSARLLGPRYASEILATNATTSNTTAVNATAADQNATSAEAPSPSSASIQETEGDVAGYIDGNVYNDTSITDSTSEGLFNQSIAGITDANGAVDDDAPDTTYISVFDSTGAFCLATDDVGNFWLDDATNADLFTYASHDQIVEGDGDDMVFFYYPEEMNTLGVSRFRMKDFDHVPKTAQAITLTPINYDNDSSTPGFYAAIDTDNNAYYLAVCSIEDLDSKIFLVKDIDAGIKTLADPNLQSVVTGGVVGECVPLALKSSGAGY